MNEDRRSALLGMKLRALVAEHLGLDTDALTVEPAPLPSGSAFVHDRRAWVLVDGPAERALGGALVWALRHDADALELVADHDTGLLARRATAFTLPIRVWFVQGRTLLAAVPEPLEPPPAAPPHHLALGELIESGGATTTVEHGVVTGEVGGLEVCRVVDEPTLGRLTDEHGMPLAVGVERVDPDGDGGVILEVGVGANDREAFQLLHGHLPKLEALAEVVDAVRGHRAPDAPPHPLNRMAPERAVRAAAVERPELLGLSRLEPVEPPVPRPSMKEMAPCVARGLTADGEERLVVFSVGVDVDLAPFVADVIHLADADGDHAPGQSVLVVLPRRDVLPITERLLALLDRPVSIVSLGPS